MLPRGKYIALLDGDLQNDPADLYKAYHIICNQQTDIVQGYRQKRLDSKSKTLPSKVANKLVRLVFNSPLHDIGCTLKIMNQRVIKDLIFLDGFHRYLPLIAHIKGYSVTEIKVNHNPRTAGVSKYGMERIWPVCKQLFFLKFNPSKLIQPIIYNID
jgi:glycosyltransferase involved in cell wall biosynthesis